MWSRRDMGGLVSCGGSVQVAPPEFAEGAAKAMGVGSGAISMLTEAQLEEFREAFNSFDDE